MKVLYYLLFLLITPLFIACKTKVAMNGNGDSQDTVTSGAKNTGKEMPEYRGDLIVEHGNIKVYANFGLLEEDIEYGDDMTSKDETYLIRYVNDIPKDSMILKGSYNTLSGENNMCMITVGTDTVNVDISKPFKKVLDLRFTGVLPECHFHRFSKHYKLNEQSFPTDFQINIAIQDDAPEYIRSFINETISDDVAHYFSDYSDGETIYPNIPLFNIKKGDLTQMSRYYYDQFCRLYKEEYSSESDTDDISHGPCYSYQFYAYPVWENSNSTLITWKFYDYCYLGGAHGGEHEYFLTFNNKTGRILGIDDFYSNDEFKKAINHLTHQLNAYHNRDGNGEYNYSASLDDPNVIAAQSTVLNEMVGGKKYPRPALIRQGIVFTYQTYEKGGNADGVLHFIQPYQHSQVRQP